MPKHIAILKYSFKSTGGLEKQTHYIIKYFLNLGYKISILTKKISKNKILHNKNVKIYFFTPFFPFKFSKVLGFDHFCKKWIKRHDPDISFSMEKTSYHSHIRAGAGVHKKYLETKKIFFKNPLKYFFYKTISPFHLVILRKEKKGFENPFVKKIIVNSNMIKSQILKTFKVEENKIVIIQNGVQWKLFQKDFESWQEDKIKILQKNKKLNPSTYFFLFVGNGYERKGLKILLKALFLIKKENFHLLVVGKDKKIKDFEKYVKKLQLENKIIFFKEQNNNKILDFYKIADCLTIPSFYDPFANVTIEALSMGLFIITSKQNGAFEIINKENGIISNLNPLDLSKALKKALLKRKTKKSSFLIRNSVKNLDFSNQLKKLKDAIL